MFRPCRPMIGLINHIDTFALSESGTLSIVSVLHPVGESCVVASASSSLLGSLPIPRTALIGRETERAVARALLLRRAVPLRIRTGRGLVRSHGRGDDGLTPLRYGRQAAGPGSALAAGADRDRRRQTRRLGRGRPRVARSHCLRGASDPGNARSNSPGENLDAISIDGAWFCNQTFALCNTALCDRTHDNPSIANCHCVVLNGYSIGFKTCEERAQVGTSLWSNFFTANVNSEFGILTCPGDAAWANCLDYPCEMDARDPALARCQCAVLKSGPFRTFGGRCDEGNCTAELLSGTPLDTPGVEQYEIGMQRVGQTITLPATCPGTTPVASDATPAAA